jgi:hypothetical protein
VGCVLNVENLQWAKQEQTQWWEMQRRSLDVFALGDGGMHWKDWMSF